MDCRFFLFSLLISDKTGRGFFFLFDYGIALPLATILRDIHVRLGNVFVLILQKKYAPLRSMSEELNYG